MAIDEIPGISFITTTVVTNSWIWNTIQLFILGSLLESGRRLWLWLTDGFSSNRLMTAEFTQGDRAYDWIILFLNEERIWQRSLQFRVQSKLGHWAGGEFGSIERNGSIYVPLYEQPQIFRWKGYWVEIKRARRTKYEEFTLDLTDVIYVSIFTFNLNVMADFVEMARTRYKVANEAKVTVHTARDVRRRRYSMSLWITVKRSTRRPLSSIVLRHGVVDSLVLDVREFLDSKVWYESTGIPHRRGYLLHGPPGTGKTSTIYALAGELGLEIYTLALSASFMTDAFFQAAVSSIPPRSILLLEDIDCAFTSRDDMQDTLASPNQPLNYGFGGYPANDGDKSQLTLSCLLNTIDGVGSDDGRILFATTNYLDRLDSALLRPGRIDINIEYKQTTKGQASALFKRFFSRSLVNDISKSYNSSPCEIKQSTSNDLEALAVQFASHIPDHEFSIAEIQGFLLTCKGKPEKAVSEVTAWVEQETEVRHDGHRLDKEYA